MDRFSRRFLSSRMESMVRAQIRSQGIKSYNPRWLVGRDDGIRVAFHIFQRSISTEMKQAIARNRTLTNLGRRGRWKQLLHLCNKEIYGFNNVNYATAMTQLGKCSRNINRNDPLLNRFINDLSLQLHKHGIESMGAREVANIIHALAKMKFLKHNTSAIQIATLVSRDENVKWLVKEGSPQNVAVISWAFVTLDINCPRFFSAIEDQAKWLVSEGNPQAVANVAWAFATLHRKAPILFSEIEQQAKWLTIEGNPQAIANTAWAFATLGRKSPTLFSAIEQRAEWLANEGSPQTIANTAWAFATLDRKAPALFSEIEKQAEQLCADGTEQAIANTLWSFAKLGVSAPNLFAEIDKHAERLVRRGKPQEISNLAWACATLGFKSRIFKEIEKGKEKILTYGTPHGIANTAWSFATLGIQSSFFSNLEKKRKLLVKYGKPQEVANTLWAFAKLNIKAPKLFSEVEDKTEWLLREGKPQEVSNVAWAFATLGMEAPMLFTNIERRAEWFVKEARAQEVANTLWAASQFMYDTPELLAKADEHGQRIVKEGNAQDLAITASAFAKLGHVAPTFFAALEEDKEEKLIKNGTAQNICNVGYSLVTLDLGKKHKVLLSKLWNCALEMNPDNGFTTEELQQLYLITAVAKIDGISLTEPSSSLRKEIRAVKQREPQSQLQREISSLLKEIGFNHEEEVSPIIDGERGGLFSIDMACRERKIAVEFDGPFHYLVGLPKGEVLRKENGKTKAKRRYLETTGWKVINLNYKDMISLKGKAAHLKWLKDEFQNANVELS